MELLDIAHHYHTKIAYKEAEIDEHYSFAFLDSVDFNKDVSGG